MPRGAKTLRKARFSVPGVSKPKKNNGFGPDRLRPTDRNAPRNAPLRNRCLRPLAALCGRLTCIYTYIYIYIYTYIYIYMCVCGNNDHNDSNSSSSSDERPTREPKAYVVSYFYKKTLLSLTILCVGS